MVHPIFNNFGNADVVPNISWFFKFNTALFLKNINNPSMFANIENINEFAHDCHYVKYIDRLIDENLSQYNHKFEHPFQHEI